MKKTNLINCIDSHTAGEPTRLVISGLPIIKGRNIKEKTEYFSKKLGGCYPPLNLAFLAAITEESGHQAEIIDAEVDAIEPDVLVNLLIEKNPDLIAMTGMTPFFHLSEDIATKLKKKGSKSKICVGGPHVTILAEKIFGPMFDFAFVGDGEASWSTFLNVNISNH